ncbi:MAG: c-type cytochrome [Terriglobales bacterium]
MVRRIAGTLFMAGMIFAWVAPSAHAAGDASAGKDVFLKKCKTCHGEDGHGNAGMAKLLNTTITPLDSDEVQSKSDADIKTIILEGKAKMKPVKGLTDADISNVIAFVRTLKK